MKLKKKILIVDNGFLAKDGESYFANTDTNKFLNDLDKIFLDITLSQFHKKINPNENILNSKVNCNILSTNFRDSNLLEKVLSYIKLSVLLTSNIYKYDLVYAFYPGNINFLSLLISFLLKKDYAIYLRGEIKLNFYLTRLLLKNAKFLVSNNSIAKHKMNFYNNNSFQIMSYINLGNRIPKISRVQKKIKTVKTINLLFVGRVEKAKGVFELIDACKMLIRKKIDFKIDIIGGGESFKLIENDIKKNKLEKSINLVGQLTSRSEIVEYYKNSDIFILPSYTEGFPRVIYTAMEYSLPIITTMVGGIPSILKDNLNCLEIRVKSASDIYEGVRRLIKNTNLYAKLSLNSFRTIKKMIENENIYLHKDILEMQLKKL